MSPLFSRFSAFSGMFFGFFLSLHIIGTSSASLGEATFNETLKLFRNVYQNPVFEVCLAASALLHMASGAILHWKRDKFGFAKSPPAKWYIQVQRLTGSILGVLVFVHVSGTRLPVLLGKQRPEDFAQLHVLFRMAPEFVWLYTGTYVVCALLHFFLSVPQIFERNQALPAGSHHKIVSNWLFWVLVATTTSSMFAGMYSFYSQTPANKADIEYWTPITQESIPPFLRNSKL